MDPVRRALYGALTADAALTGLLAAPDGIYHRRAPATAAHPLIVFHNESGTPEWQFAGHRIDTDVWAIKAIDQGSSSSRAEAIAEEIWRVLTDAALTVAGRDLVACYAGSTINYGEGDGADQYHHVGARYRVLTHPTEGTA